MAVVTRTLPSFSDLSGRWVAILEESGQRPAILALADRFPEERSLELPFSVVDSTDRTLADLLLARPEEILKAGTQAMRELLPIAGPEAEGLRLRVTGLPLTARRSIREIREADLNHLIAIDGLVRKVTDVRPQIKDAVFQCLQCRVEFHEPQEEGAAVFREPLECPEAQGGCGRPAGRTRFRLVPERSTYVDAQRIEIQENPETLHRGAHPQGIPILLTEDLAGRVVPGNRVIVNGVLKSSQRASPSRAGLVRATTFDLMISGNSLESKEVLFDEIQLSEEDQRLIGQFEGDPTVVDKIVLSLAPTIKDMDEEKEAIALQLFGGVMKRYADGVRTRGDIHVLLIGDPGTAKSQLLRYIAEVAPHGIYTSGKGATAAGLTAAAVKDDFAGGRWMLEAGMLVLADGGMAVVDELDKMTPEDRSAMHEVLEQQTVSIAKAGITATLNARCPVLAAANPKLGRFTKGPVAQQLDLPATLLSRFDVIFSIKDKPNQERDRRLASQILLSHKGGGVGRLTEDGAVPSASPAPPFSPEFLKKYVAYAKRIVPQLSQEALRTLEDFYVQIRKQGEGEDAPVPITARQLEALVRLSEAAARARLSPVVAPEDAQRATRIVENFLKRVASDSTGGLDVDMIMSGTSHSQRVTLTILTEIMQRLQDRPQRSFTLQELEDEARKQEIEPHRTQSLFAYLRNAGEVIEASPGIWQLVRF